MSPGWGRTSRDLDDGKRGKEGADARPEIRDRTHDLLEAPLDTVNGGGIESCAGHLDEPALAAGVLGQGEVNELGVASTDDCPVGFEMS